MKITLTREVELSKSELEMLIEINRRNYVFNFDLSGSRLEICDSLVDKGLCSEDPDGRVNITRDGRKVLVSNEADRMLN